MTAPSVSAFQIYEYSAVTTFTINIAADIPADNVGDMYQVVILFDNPAGNASPIIYDIGTGFSLKHSNHHAVGTHDLVIYERVATLGEGTASQWQWTNAKHVIVAIVLHGAGGGVIESGGFLSSDRTGLQKLNMSNINPGWDVASDTEYVQYWGGDDGGTPGTVSGITNTGETSEVFLYQHSNIGLTLASYSVGKAASTSYTPETDVLDPTVDTLRWLGIGHGLRGSFEDPEPKIADGLYIPALYEGQNWFS